jgi:hypothetical protein
MKLYVAQRQYDYEGFDILGIFSNKDVAERTCEEAKCNDGIMQGDKYYVTQFTLDVKTGQQSVSE